MTRSYSKTRVFTVILHPKPPIGDTQTLLVGERRVWEQPVGEHNRPGMSEVGLLYPFAGWFPFSCQLQVTMPQMGACLPSVRLVSLARQVLLGVARSD